MVKKKIAGAVLAGVMILSCVGTAWAMEKPNGTGEQTAEVVRLEELTRGPVDSRQVVSGDIATVTRATESISWTISAGKTAKASTAFPMEADEIVTINCSYSPSSDLVDFGLIAPDNKFYYVTGEGGSINQSIRISERGDYYLAVRNRSSKSVEVVGFVNY